MANRIPIPSIPRPSLPVSPKRVAAAVAWRPPEGDARRLLLFRLAWSPFWIGSDLPKPRPRAAESPLPPGGMVGDYVAGELTRLTRRIWLQQTLSTLARALWLPLFVACAWLAVELAGGPELKPIVVVALWAITIPLGVGFSLIVRPGLRRVARMLDRSFALQERMITAFDNIGRDVPAEGERPSISYLQLADAANVISDLRTHPAFRVRPPVREIVMTMVCILTLSALFFLRGVGDGLPGLSVNPVPAFVPAAERLARQPEPQPQAGVVQADAPTREQVLEMAQRSSQAQQDLKLLGDALSDQAVTRAAAEAIQRGDYAAADLIRQAAENADQLSPAARSGLADDLDAAAEQMSPGQTGLAGATRDAAAGLRAGGEEAKSGMSALGDAVDSVSSAIVSQEELAGQMSRAEAAEAAQTGDEQSGSSSSNQADAGDASAPSGESGSGQPSDSPEGASGLPSSSSASSPDEATDGSSNGDPSDSGDPGGAADPGGSQADGAPEGGDPQPGNASGNETESGGEQPGDGQSPANGQSRGNPSDRQGPDDGTGGQGGGAGSGESSSQESSNAGAGSQSGEEGSGAPSEPKEADDPSKTGDAVGAEQDPRTAITLSRSPEGAGVQTGGQGNSASVGSGSGASIGSGATVQGEVGAAGPDSNHVPSDYRGIVEDFFSDGDGS